MPAYVIGIKEKTIHPQAWENYLKLAKVSFPSTARALARFGDLAAPEGHAAEGVAIFEFPTLDAAREWYESAAYQGAVQARAGAALFKLYLVDGV